MASENKLQEVVQATLAQIRNMIDADTVMGTPVETASGTTLTEGRTIAVDKNKIPLGSIVHIDGFGDFIAEDTGSAIKGNKIDIFVSSHAEAYRLGIRYANVYIKAN